MSSSDLTKVEALVFDVFGTVVDWESSVIRLLSEKANSTGSDKLTAIDWKEFTWKWRQGYMRRTREIAGGANGPTHVDELHRELLDGLLAQDEYAAAGQAWGEDDRNEATQFWHKLDAWPDSLPGLQALYKAGKLTATLSNGSTRLLVDLARHSSPRLPFDLIVSATLTGGTYKPEPKTYQGVCNALDLPTEKTAMVASHVWDLEAAAKQGMKTIYVHRKTEDTAPGAKDGLKLRSEGGYVDAIVNGIDEIAALLA